MGNQSVYQSLEGWYAYNDKLRREKISMALFKKKITEQNAVEEFTHWTTEAVLDSWPDVYRDFQSSVNDICKENVIAKDEKMAAFNLYLSIIAINLIVIQESHPKDQADRLKSLIIEAVTPEKNDLTLKLLDSYQKEWNKAVERKEVPFDAITVRLFREWLDDENFNKICAGQFVDPILVTAMAQRLMHFYGGWKKIVDNYNLIHDQKISNV